MKSISIRGLYKTYRAKGNADVPALKGVSFDLPERGMVFILGKSGCGKSTLLNVLGGLDSFDSGDVVIDGKSMKDFSAKDTDRHRNEKVGFVFQENNLLEEYTVERNVGLAVELQSEKSGGDLVAAALTAVDLKDFGDRKCNRLSGGQKQRVAIARAIVKKPEILLCDEPTGALDSDTGEEIFNLLKKISENTLVVVVSHDRDSAEKYGDRIIELKDGQVISDSGAEYKSDDAESQPQAQKKGGGLPAKRALSIGAGFLIARPVRLALCIIICLITFTCVGVSDTFASYNREKTIADNLIQYKTPYYIFTQTSTFDLEKLDESFSYTKQPLSETEYERLKTLVACNRYDKVYRFDLYNYDEYGGNLLHSSYGINESQGDYHVQFYGITEIDENFVSDYNFKLYGKYPENYGEIVISDYMFEGFKAYGYKPKDGNLHAISSYDDIIGKTLSHTYVRYSGAERIENDLEFKVVGVLDTNMNKEIYDRVMFKEYEEEYSILDSANDTMSQFGLQSAMFTANGFYENYFIPESKRLENYKNADKHILSVIAPITGGKKQMLEAARIHERYHSGPMEFDHYAFFMLTGDAQYVVDHEDDTMRLCKIIFFYTALGTAVVSALFVLYYVSGVVADKKRQIGILRSLGASKGDIFKIFAAQNGIFAAGMIALATVFSAVADVIINSHLTKGYVAKTLFLSFSIRQFAVIAAVAILAVAVGIIIPVVKMLMAKPVDIISGRK